MARYKDFGSGSSTIPTEKLTFSLYGETFECRPAMQGKFLLDMVAQSDGDDPSAAAAVVNEFFERVLFEESYARFEALLADPEKIVTVETLGEITGWLVGEYSERPTTPPESSSNGG